jgi:tetratricopeptide (TPR) repeat protein
MNKENNLKDVDKLIEKAWNLWQEGKEEEARRVYDQVFSSAPDYHKAWLSKISALLLNKRYAELREVLKEAMDIPCSDPFYWQFLASVWQKLGNEEMLEECLIKLAESEFYEIEEAYEEGMEMIEKGDHEKALEVVERALSLRPDDVDLMYLKGCSLFALGQLDSAWEIVNEALMTEDGKVNPDIWFLKGLILKKKGQFGEALEAYDKAILFDEEPSEEILIEKGDTLLTLERYDEAMEAFLFAKELNPENFLALKGIAKIELERGNYEQAITGCREALDLYKGDAEVWRMLAIAYYALEEFNLSAKAATEATQREPKNPENWRLRIFSYLKAGHNPQALRAINRILELEPMDGDMWFLKATICAKINKKETALESLAKALELKPQLKREARANESFKSLHNDKRFQSLVKEE